MTFLKAEGVYMKQILLSALMCIGSLLQASHETSFEMAADLCRMPINQYTEVPDTFAHDIKCIIAGHRDISLRPSTILSPVLQHKFEAWKQNQNNDAPLKQLSLPNGKFNPKGTETRILYVDKPDVKRRAHLLRKYLLEQEEAGNIHWLTCYTSPQDSLKYQHAFEAMQKPINECIMGTLFRYHNTDVQFNYMYKALVPSLQQKQPGRNWEKPWLWDENHKRKFYQLAKDDTSWEKTYKQDHHEMEQWLKLNENYNIKDLKGSNEWLSGSILNFYKQKESWTPPNPDISFN
jgi:hypothetical protein